MLIVSYCLNICILRSIKHMTLVSMHVLCLVYSYDYVIYRAAKGKQIQGPLLIVHLNYLRGYKYNTYTFFNAAGVPMQEPRISRRGGGEGAISHVFCRMM